MAEDLLWKGHIMSRYLVYYDQRPPKGEIAVAKPFWQCEKHELGEHKNDIEAILNAERLEKEKDVIPVSLFKWSEDHGVWLEIHTF